MLSKMSFRLSRHLRNFYLLPQSMVSHHSYKFGTTAKAEPSQFVNSDVDVNKSPFKTVTIPLDVLNCILDNNKSNVQLTIDAIENLSNYYQTEKKSLYISQKNAYKSILCILTTSLKVNKMKVSDLIKVLKILNSVKVSVSTEAVSSVLHSLNASISSMSLEDYYEISSLLTKMPDNSLTDIISTNLKKKFILKITTEFDESNIEFLTNALKYSSTYLQDPKIIQIIMDGLKKNNLKDLPISNTVSLMYALLKQTPGDSDWFELLRRVQNNLINNVDQLDDKTIQQLLWQIAHVIHSKRILEFYNDKLYDAFADKLVKSDVNFEFGVSILRSFIKCKHASKKFLSYISAKYYEEKQITMTNHHYELDDLRTLVQGLSKLKYKPIFWDEIFTALKTKKMLEYSSEDLLFYSLHLACLDSYDPLVLTKIFRTDFEFQKNKYVAFVFLLLWQKLKTLPNYDGPLPSQQLINTFNNLNFNYIDNTKILPTLEKIVGGPQYVKTNVRSQLHHVIDHVIVVQNDGNSVEINNDNDNNNVEEVDKNFTFLQDISVPPNSHLIAIIYMPSWWYNRNIQQLEGEFSMYFETLEALGYKVIAISEDHWNSLLEDSKVSFLTNEINQIKSNLHFVGSC